MIKNELKIRGFKFVITLLLKSKKKQKTKMKQDMLPLI